MVSVSLEDVQVCLSLGLRLLSQCVLYWICLISSFLPFLCLICLNHNISLSHPWFPFCSSVYLYISQNLFSFIDAVHLHFYNFFLQYLLLFSLVLTVFSLMLICSFPLPPLSLKLSLPQPLSLLSIGGELYTGLKADFLGRDSVIFRSMGGRSTMRTETDQKLLHGNVSLFNQPVQ